MGPKVYLETTIPSYLTAYPSRDLVKAAHQQITREWWQDRARFDLYISQVVLREASGGDAEAARLRLEVLRGIPVLALSPAASRLAQQLVLRGALGNRCGGFSAYRYRCGEWDGLSADVELHAHRKCCHTAPD